MPPDPRPVLLAKIDRPGGHSLRVVLERDGSRPVVTIGGRGGTLTIAAAELAGLACALDLAREMIGG